MNYTDTGKILASLLQEALDGQGFTKRGKSFFRVHGDGVLQTVNFTYEVHGGFYDLSIGLFSMYGELSPEFFTSTRYRPEYPIVRLVGRDCAHWARLVGKHQLSFLDTPVREQLAIFQEKGIPFLNSIRSQQHLADALYELETAVSAKRMCWRDPLKFAPYIKSGNYECAERVLKAIIDQRLWILFEENYLVFDDEDYRDFCENLDEYGQYIYGLYKMVRSRDDSGLQDWLNQNYEKNLGYAKFCMKRR